MIHSSTNSGALSFSSSTQCKHFLVRTWELTRIGINNHVVSGWLGGSNLSGLGPFCSDSRVIWVSLWSVIGLNFIIAKELWWLDDVKPGAFYSTTHNVWQPTVHTQRLFLLVAGGERGRDNKASFSTRVPQSGSQLGWEGCPLSLKEAVCWNAFYEKIGLKWKELYFDMREGVCFNTRTAFLPEWPFRCLCSFVGLGCPEYVDPSFWYHG